MSPWACTCWRTFATVPELMRHIKANPGHNSTVNRKQ